MPEKIDDRGHTVVIVDGPIETADPRATGIGYFEAIGWAERLQKEGKTVYVVHGIGAGSHRVWPRSPSP